MDNKKKIVERSVIGILEILGTLGGIQEISFALVGMAYGVISSQAFIGSLVRKFFYVRSRTNLTE
jgi:hypothetical protein